MIPKLIFQTYKERTLQDCPSFMQECAETWIEKNKEYEYIYISDSDAKKFIYNEYGLDYLKLFVNVPVNVIKADIIRLVYTYKYGGIYADMDSVCISPIDNWANLSYDFIVSTENASQIVQWFFMTKKENPIIKNTINSVFSTISEKNYKDLPLFVMGTGSFMLTKCLLDFYNIYDRVDISNIKVLDSHQIKTFFMPTGSFIDGEVKHLYGSKNWKENYDRWVNHNKVNNEMNLINLQENFWEFWRYR